MTEQEIVEGNKLIADHLTKQIIHATKDEQYAKDIVIAVNCHADLLNGLKQAEEMLYALEAKTQTTPEMDVEFKTLMNLIEAAIKKATE